VFPDVDSRHLHAAVVLAEELNFTRAAQILGISQPALSKQITELEEQYQLHLFVREKGRIVELTEAGKVFVKEARAALFHTERAIHLAHAAHQGVENATALSVAFICAYFSFEFQFAFGIAFRHATTKPRVLRADRDRNDALLTSCRPAIAEE
jgi:DNA-binding transcriptional LysR family regulator